ncbi:uncharacterized protein Tco025E_03302 [Trypanosoma conorhini]|uniref:Uncharacterized protein n=1 Tax=Trypanosoma conorhini TaxID=83891 RepID=A0A422PW35_9TRYP|nr:uncharacterized protein Tco025E_03302 [Trypanosoma conorhini]RNF21707.1 hypothetical protein Tco025E_03302 [Trypanosoma conorhini]
MAALQRSRGSSGRGGVCSGRKGRQRSGCCENFYFRRRVCGRRLRRVRRVDHWRGKGAGGVAAGCSREKWPQRRRCVRLPTAQSGRPQSSVASPHRARLVAAGVGDSGKVWACRGMSVRHALVSFAAFCARPSRRGAAGSVDLQGGGFRVGRARSFAGGACRRCMCPPLLVLCRVRRHGPRGPTAARGSRAAAHAVAEVRLELLGRLAGLRRREGSYALPLGRKCAGRPVVAGTARKRPGAPRRRVSWRLAVGAARCGGGEGRSQRGWEGRVLRWRALAARRAAPKARRASSPPPGAGVAGASSFAWSRAYVPALCLERAARNRSP